MKERITPTHFIEVWTHKGKVYNGTIHNINYMDRLLNVPKLLGKYPTIAIWKIKFKNL